MSCLKQLLKGKRIGDRNNDHWGQDKSRLDQLPQLCYNAKSEFLVKIKLKRPHSLGARWKCRVFVGNAHFLC